MKGILMLNDFKLKIDNFGPINKADLDISKINIIAGKNASGKTTVSKLLYCIITAFSTDGEYLTYESMKDELELLINNLQISQSETKTITELEEIQMKINLNQNNDLKIIDEGYTKLESILNSLEFTDREFFLNSIERNRTRLQNSKKIGFYWQLLVNLIRNEFSGDEQLLNNFNESEILFYNHNSKDKFRYIVRIDKGIGILPETEFEKTITTNREAIYIETPYFLDYKIPFLQFERYGKKQHHQSLLYQKLIDQSAQNDILDPDKNKETIEFQNKINEMINGKFYFNNNGLLEFIQNGQTFDLANTSTGLKSIGILQLLLENRKLKENTYLIMDEPEVHLHPEWQVKLAHILVLLVKELNVNLFINSHSPQFIEAMEVYTIKYGLRNEINFYLSKKDENNEKYNIEKIEYDKLYELYNNLGDPYDIVDEVRGENLANRL